MGIPYSLWWIGNAIAFATTSAAFTDQRGFCAIDAAILRQSQCVDRHFLLPRSFGVQLLAGLFWLVHGIEERVEIPQ